MKKGIFFLLFFFLCINQQFAFGMKRKRYEAAKRPAKRRRVVHSHTSIPDEIMQTNVFPFADSSTLFQCRLACRQWKEAVAAHSKQHALQISVTKNETLEQSFPDLVNNLKNLDFHFYLEFIDCFVLDEDIETLKPLKENLVGLHIMSSAFNKENQVTDVGLETLPHFNNLTKLNLTGFDFITDKGMAHLKKLKNLRTIEICNCAAITDKSMSHLARLPKLQKVLLTWCPITGKGIKKLASIRSLQELTLEQCNNFNGTSLHHFAKHKRLQKLGLHSCQGVSDANLSKLPVTLTELSVTSCPQVTPEGIQSLGNLKNLKALNLSHNSFLTDASLCFLLQLSNLERLTVRWCNELTGWGLCDFLPRSIKLVDVRSCAQITQKIVATLQSRGIKVLSNFNI